MNGTILRNLLVAIGENDATYILYAFFRLFHVECDQYMKWLVHLIAGEVVWWRQFVEEWRTIACGPCGDGSPTTEGTWARYHYCDMTLLQEIYTMGAQLSVKAALPLIEILATSDSCSNTGPGWWFTGSGEFGEIVTTRKLPESKVHGANMEPILGRQDPGGPHVSPHELCYLGSLERISGLGKAPPKSLLFSCLIL